MTQKKLLIIAFTGVLLFLNHDLANAQFSDVDPTHPYAWFTNEREL